MRGLKKSNRRVEKFNIPAKANRILNVVLVGMILIVLRVWHLAIIQYDEKLDESRKPQRRVELEPAKRATISDRFNIPLAMNQLQYNVAILYAQIRQIPTTIWETNGEGKRIKRFKRKEYITALARLLGKELDMDAERVEDLIHAKAALYNQIPFVIKEDVTEREYYRLKMLEKDWVGINVQRVPRRVYPKGKVASDMIGYMGAINRQEYEKVIREIKLLEECLQAVDLGEVGQLPEGIISIENAYRRLKDLQELAYSVNDSIGKAGIEGRFEHVLRGFRGKKSYYSDARGNFLRELPGIREPLSGKRIILSISSELQEYTEQLLVENEQIRHPTLARLGRTKRTIPSDKEPWIKGGAIVAIDPNNGEVLAMASHPRFDPNDFLKKSGNVFKWIESEDYLAAIWDQQRPLEREVFEKTKGIYLEERRLTWENYLDFVLGTSSPLRNTVLINGTIHDAIVIQRNVEALLQLSPYKDAYLLFDYLYRDEEQQQQGERLSLAEARAMDAMSVDHAQEIQEVRQVLDGYFKNIPHTYDKVLLVDLLRILVDGGRFSKLPDPVGKQGLSSYKEAAGAAIAIQEVVKKMVKELFHEIDFKEWRKSNEKSFLRQKREEEKMAGRYAKPYIDYLDAIESEQFQEFWEHHRWQLLIAFLKGDLPCGPSVEIFPYFQYLKSWHWEIAQGAHAQIEWRKAYEVLASTMGELSLEEGMAYLRTFRSFHDLDRPLLGRYRQLRKKGQEQLEKHLAAAFYPKYGYGYGRSQAYRQAAPQGSIFKLVTAYEALIQQYTELENSGKSVAELNPLEMTDRVFYKGKELHVGLLADGTPIPRHYKGGRMPRSARASIGPIDILKAIEMTSNPYFALLAGDVLKHPRDLAEAAQKFSFGSRTGIDLPGEIGGNIPDDLEFNRTGLYSFAIGQHTLVVTPLQTAVMLSALVNGGKVFEPKIVKLMVGKEPRRGKELISKKYHFPYQEGLSYIGIDFPLFIATDAEQQQCLIRQVPTRIKREVFLPAEVQRVLLDGMCRVVSKTQNQGLGLLTRVYKDCPNALKDYLELQPKLIGKTSTAESVESIDLDLKQGTNIYTHVWFGGIAYEEEILDKKENRFLFRDSFGAPELVVIVYLRYGGYGREAAPIAAQVAKKWKEIKEGRKDKG